MAGKKDNAVVAVISDLTKNQAAQISKEIMKAKANYAPHGRGTIATGCKSSVGSLIQSGRKRRRLILWGNGRQLIQEHRKQGKCEIIILVRRVVPKRMLKDTIYSIISSLEHQR